MITDTDAPTELYVDTASRAGQAVALLVAGTTLADHVYVAPDGDVTHIFHNSGDVPFFLWGEGTKGLWRLALAMTSPVYDVSLFRVFAHLDPENTRVAVKALAVLGGQS